MGIQIMYTVVLPGIIKWEQLIHTGTVVLNKAVVITIHYLLSARKRKYDYTVVAYLERFEYIVQGRTYNLIYRCFN